MTDVDTTTTEHPDDESAVDEEGETRPAVEVVERSTPAETAPAVRERSALEHAAEELMATPGAPGRDEFLVLATTARVLSMSAGAPPAVRNNPWLAFHLALIGRDLGISPSASLALIDVIGYDERAPSDYSKVQLSLSPELLNGQIRRLGLGSIVKAASSATACTAVALLPGGRVDPRCARVWPDHVEVGAPGGPCRCTLDLVLGDVEFTWDDAQQARLVDGACAAPDAHTDLCVKGGTGSGGKRCHQGYRTYPKRMMWWRAASWCQSDYFPEAGIGLYTPEELGAVVDPETGRPVDPATAALPEGYEEPERPRSPADDLLADATAETDQELALARDDLRARLDAIKAAGDEPQQALRELWERVDEDGNRRWPSFPHLRRRHLTGIRGMVRSVEARVQRSEWGDGVRAAWSDAAVGGAAPSEAQEQPDAAAGADARPAAGPPASEVESVRSDEHDPTGPTDEDRERIRSRAEQIAEEAGVPVPPRLTDAQTEALDMLRQGYSQAVAPMSSDELKAELRERGLSLMGNDDAKRRRLVDAMLDEARAEILAED